MRAISLPQPHATLAAHGLYTNITFGWSTDYRGPIAIHASRTFRRSTLGLPAVEHALTRAGVSIEDLTFDAILAVGDLYDVRRTRHFAASGSLIDPGLIVIPEAEFAFGDFAPGHWVYRMRDLQLLPVPVGVFGGQNIWPVPQAVAISVERQLEEEVGA